VQHQLAHRDSCILLIQWVLRYVRFDDANHDVTSFDM
jgi:hypothetical protein